MIKLTNGIEQVEMDCSINGDELTILIPHNEKFSWINHTKYCIKANSLFDRMRNFNDDHTVNA